MSEHSEHKEEKEEIMVLGHDPFPGFKTAFFIAFLIGCLYFAAIMFNIF